MKTIVCAHASYGPVLYNNHMTMISSWQEIFEKMRLSLILRKFIANEYKLLYCNSTRYAERNFSVKDF